MGNIKISSFFSILLFAMALSIPLKIENYYNDNILSDFVEGSDFTNNDKIEYLRSPKPTNRISNPQQTQNVKPSSGANVQYNRPPRVSNSEIQTLPTSSRFTPNTNFKPVQTVAKPVYVNPRPATTNKVIDIKLENTITPTKKPVIPKDCDPTKDSRCQLMNWNNGDTAYNKKLLEEEKKKKEAEKKKKEEEERKKKEAEEKKKRAEERKRKEEEERIRKEEEEIRKKEEEIIEEQEDIIKEEDEENEEENEEENNNE